MEKKNTILIFIGLLLLSSFTILSIYIYYRNSINPNNMKGADIKVIQTSENKKEDKAKESFVKEKDVIYETNEVKVSKSVFETDLEINKYLKEKGNKSLPLNTVNEKLDSVIVNQKTNEIMSCLYNEDFKESTLIAKEISQTYDFTDEDFRNFEVFIYEVLNFEDYNSLPTLQKIELLEELYSPELILYIYLMIDDTTRMDITKNKINSEVFSKFNSLSYSVYFKTHLKAGLYSEMNINNAYFIVPDDIEGYKIKFTIDKKEYILYYVRNMSNDKIEIIKLDNLSVENGATINDFINQ